MTPEDEQFPGLVLDHQMWSPDLAPGDTSTTCKWPNANCMECSVILYWRGPPCARPLVAWPCFDLLQKILWQARADVLSFTSSNLPNDKKTPSFSTRPSSVSQANVGQGILGLGKDYLPEKA